MGAFSDIELEWGSSTFIIRGQRVMGAISRIEEVITLHELHTYQQRGAYPVAKLRMAYASVLRYAGARVNDEEVYEKAFSGENEQIAVITAVMNLMKMMVPASARAKFEAAMADPDGVGAPASGETGLGNSRPTATASSRPPLKRRSERAAGA